MGRITARLLGLTAAATLSIAAAPAAASPATQPDGTRTVTYHGYRIAVPASWDVVSLDNDPTACVRFDRPAVYLGHRGEQSACPAGLRGRTAGLMIEPFDADVAERAAQATVATGATADTAVSSNDTIQIAVRDAGVLVTGVHTPSTESAVREVLASATLTRDAVPAALPLPAAMVATPLAAAGPQPGTYLGRGFDTCTAPSQSAMNAWRSSSPYGAVGIYISGASRSCAQPNLTATWVTNQTNNGWRLIPIELDYQAPCGTRAPKMSSDPATARSQGAARAGSAVNAAQALGIGAGSTLYNDIEHYPTNASCRAAVLSFLSGWTDGLHARGYLAGMYSSGSSGIKDVCYEYDNPNYTRVDQIWIAWWNGVADTDAGSYCPDAYWADHQRLHQYAGNVTETWGGVSINIDRNYLDVAVDQQPPPQEWTTTIDNTTAGGFTASANWGTSSYSSQRYGVDYRFANPVSASDVAWYQADIPATDTYEISVWYPANSGYNNLTPYIVATTTGNQSVHVNQRTNGGQWVSIGVFTLAAGDGNKVGVSRWTSGTGYVIADAVRITRV